MKVRFGTPLPINLETGRSLNGTIDRAYPVMEHAGVQDGKPTSAAYEAVAGKIDPVSESPVLPRCSIRCRSTRIGFAQRAGYEPSTNLREKDESVAFPGFGPIR